MGSISLSTSRIVSEKRVLSAADKSIMNDPKAQILLYKTGYILEKNSLFQEKKKPTRSERRHWCWSSHSLAFVDAERWSEFFCFFRQTEGALRQIFDTAANFGNAFDRPRKLFWASKRQSTRAFQRTLVFFCFTLFHLVLKSHVRARLGNLSWKTGCETELSRQIIRRKKAQQDFETGFQAGQGLASAPCSVQKYLSQVLFPLLKSYSAFLSEIPPKKNPVK